MEVNDLKIKVILPFRTSFLDYPDDENICISIFCTGCDNNCNECSNIELQDYYYKNSVEMRIEDFENEIKKLAKNLNTKKVALLGGDFLYRKNINFTKEFLKRNQLKYDICLYTGKTIDFVKENNVTGFKFVKCGKYKSIERQDSMKTDKELIFASKNQELYDSKFNLLSKDGVYKF